MSCWNSELLKPKNGESSIRILRISCETLHGRIAKLISHSSRTLTSSYPQTLTLPNNWTSFWRRRNVQMLTIFAPMLFRLTSSMSGFDFHETKPISLDSPIRVCWSLNEESLSNNQTLLFSLPSGLARPFHNKVFIYNQYATNFSR